MNVASTSVYRTVVKTTWLEDSSELTNEYDWKTRRYNAVPVHCKGDVTEEIFGPYALKSSNQDYSTHQIFKRVETDEPAYRREDWAGMSDEVFNRSYAHIKKVDWVKVADHEVHKQELKAVMKQTDGGSFELATEWIDY